MVADPVPRDFVYQLVCELLLKVVFRVVGQEPDVNRVVGFATAVDICRSLGQRIIYWVALPLGVGRNPVVDACFDVVDAHLAAADETPEHVECHPSILPVL